MNTTQGYVLIVEDDPDILNLLKTTLEFNGYCVLTARNGYEALDAVHQQRPAVVVADILMPRLDGFGLVNRLRINPETRDIPVVVISATYIAPEDRKFAQNIGATRFIQKPIDLERFLQTIRELPEPGASVVPEPLKDFDFYDGYRTRLESKLEERNAQIAREELLLKSTLPDEERTAIHASLRRAVSEREEIKILLEQIHAQLKKY
jgi:CheY-like chemotaxis protein